MALYDDIDTKQRPDKIDGWSSGIKLFQSQMAIKKATVTAPRRDPQRKPATLAPVIDLKTKKDSDIDDIFKPAIAVKLPPSSGTVTDYDWDVIDEYDPLWPNDYEKLVKDKRDKEREKNREREERRREERERKRKANSNKIQFNEEQAPITKFSGFGSRPAGHSDDEDSYNNRSPPNTSASNNSNRIAGAAIAPPPSLQENINADSSKSPNVNIPYGTSSVAAKIMAKYGFKDGQGLGKQEQGMSIALQVEKTSKRGGRIIHEKELLMPPPPASNSPKLQAISSSATIDLQLQQQQQVQMVGEPSITEIMKSPSKVVLLRNMVGPGDVDDELEPEVKDECNTKYGEVITVIIHEIPNVVAEEAVRIFVEFKRIESAIKAVVDLNGRFFGGRQVRAGFYNFEKFENLQLMG